MASSLVHYTITNLAEHFEGVSHDQINRYLSSEKLTPSLLWESVSPHLCRDPKAYLAFDDTVLDKRHARLIELTRQQYSGNEHRLIRGIGLVSCLYANSQTGQSSVIDYRLSDKDGDGQSKLERVAEMLDDAVNVKQLPLRTVLMGTWYASQKLMAQIDQLVKDNYCPLKRNRRVDGSGGTQPYQCIGQLDWSGGDLQNGKLIKI